MRLLLIDTVSPRGGLHLQGDTGVTSQSFKDRLQQSAQIVTLLERLLKKGKVTLQQLDAIAIVTGPGSFTSARIGVSFGNALAYALGRPAVGFSRFAWARLQNQAQSSTKSSKKSVKSSPILIDGGPAGYFQAVRTNKITRFAPGTLSARQAAQALSATNLEIAFMLAKKALLAPKVKTAKNLPLVQPLYGGRPNITKPKKKHLK